MRITWTKPANTTARSEAQVAPLSVVVPYTTTGLTQTALQYVDSFEELKVNVRLIDVHVVPFPVPLSEPTVRRKFLEERLRVASEETQLPTRAELVLTRDRADAFQRILEPGSLIVIAMRGWWWFSAEKKLARLLSKAGHDVVLLADRTGNKVAVRRFSQPTAHLVR